VPQGSSLFNTLQTIASAGSYPIVLDDSVIEASGSSPSIVSTFQSAPTPGGEVSERDELRDALVSVPSLRVVPVTGDDGAVDLYAIVSR